MVVSVLNCEQRRLSKIDSGKSKPSCRRTGEYTGGDAAFVLAGPAHSMATFEKSLLRYTQSADQSSTYHGTSMMTMRRFPFMRSAAFSQVALRL